MKKALKYIIGIILLLILLMVLYFWLFVHESKPTQVEGNAQAKAEQMLTAVNKKAWDTLNYVSWSFRGEHDYVWDKTKNDAIVKWGGTEVHLDPDEVTGNHWRGVNCCRSRSMVFLV